MTEIVLITHGFNIGGTELLVKEIALNQVNSRSVAVVALDHDGPLRNELEAANIKTFALGRATGLKLENFQRFFGILKLLKPRVIHAHQYTAFLYAALFKMLYARNTKLIFTEHGRHFPDKVSIKRKIVNIFLKYTCNKITAVCNFAKNALTKNELLGSNITVIYNGISISEAALNNLRAELNISKNTLIIGYIGSLRAVKNPSLLLSAFARVKKEEPDCALIFIGDGYLKDSLLTETKKLELEQSVFFLGNRLPASSYINSFDIFVQPSLSEAHSLALLEAFARKVPVIATSVGGAAESIEDGKNGLLCKSNDVQDLTNCILKLIKNPELRESFKEQGYQTYLSRFTAEKMIVEYEKIYDELLSK